MQKQVLVIIGAGGIGIAIARRSGFGKKILLSDVNKDVLNGAYEEMIQAGYDVETQIVDVTSRDSVKALANHAAKLGAVLGVVNTAGLSPNMASADKILDVDLYGSALVFEQFEPVIAPRGSALIISSMAGHMAGSLAQEDEHALAFTPTEELLALDCLSKEQITDPMTAYCISKKANHLRVQAAAVSYGDKGARVNSISPGIISTALAQHELNSEIGDGYRAFIEASAAKRLASPDEVAVLANYLLSEEASFVTGSDILMDGGVIAAMKANRVVLPG
ncbi:MAG: SDR family oxidoreductase [Pseudoalteromonas distincta]|uniref:SDR family oxidoreductase n=1 Tax=Pseudoalteromonas distincta TaxID=77608 RepID=UPI003F95F356